MTSLGFFRKITPFCKHPLKAMQECLLHINNNIFQPTWFLEEKA